MLLELSIKQRHCLTCEHWMGTRFYEKSGVVHAPLDLTGCCMQAKVSSVMHGANCLDWFPWEVTKELLGFQ